MTTTSKDRGTAVANTIAVWIIATVALLYLFRSASQLLIPIVLAVLFSYALEPVVAWLARHVPRVAGTRLVLLIRSDRAIPTLQPHDPLMTPA